MYTYLMLGVLATMFVGTVAVYLTGSTYRFIGNTVVRELRRNARSIKHTAVHAWQIFQIHVLTFDQSEIEALERKLDDWKVTAACTKRADLVSELSYTVLRAGSIRALIERQTVKVDGFTLIADQSQVALPPVDFTNNVGQKLTAVTLRGDKHQKPEKVGAAATS